MSHEHKIVDFGSQGGRACKTCFETERSLKGNVPHAKHKALKEKTNSLPKFKAHHTDTSGRHWHKFADGSSLTVNKGEKTHKSGPKKGYIQ